MSPFKTRWTFLKGYVLLNFELTNNGYFALDFIVSKAISVFYVPSNRVQRAKQAVILLKWRYPNKKFLKQVEVWKITSTTGSLLPPSWTKEKMKANFSYMDSVLSYQTLVISHLNYVLSIQTVLFRQKYQGIICNAIVFVLLPNMLCQEQSSLV